MLGIPATMSPLGRNCLTAKVEVQLPVLWFAKLPRIASSIYALMSVKIYENTGKPNHSSTASLSLVEIKIYHPARVCACHVSTANAAAPRIKMPWNATASCWTLKRLAQIPVFSFHWPRNYPNNILQSACFRGLSSTMAASGAYIVGFEFSMQSTGQPTW